MNDSVTALFAGPDDKHTCDEGGPDDTGCDGAVNGGPYTFATVPLPGSFRCQTNCRHFVQLDGDAPDGVETIDWNDELGFIYGDDEDTIEPLAPDQTLDDILADNPDSDTVDQYFAVNGTDEAKDAAEAGFDDSDSETAQTLADALDQVEPDSNWHTEVRADGRWYVVSDDTQTLQESLREGGAGNEQGYFPGEVLPMIETIKLVSGKLKLREGGEGSGNHGHAGRPGEVGGSSSSAPSSHAVDNDAWAAADGATLDKLDTVMPHIYKHDALHRYSTGNDTLDRQTLAILNGVRGNADADVKVYKATSLADPTPGVHDSDYVTVNRQHAVDQAKLKFGDNAQIVSRVVKAGDLYGHPKSIQQQKWLTPEGLASIDKWQGDEKTIDGEWVDITHTKGMPRLPPGMIIESERRRKKLRLREGSARLKLREGGEGSGDFGHPGNSPHVGGSGPGGRSGPEGASVGVSDYPIDTSRYKFHIAKVTDKPGLHIYEMFKNGNGNTLDVKGHEPSDDPKQRHLERTVKESILDAIVHNIESIPDLPRKIDDVFFAKSMSEGTPGYPFYKDYEGTAAVTTIDSPLGRVLGFDLNKIAVTPRIPSNYAVYSRAKTPQDYGRLIADHEMGHVLYNAMPRNAKVEWHDVWTKSQPLELFSTYSYTTSSEGFAEAYCAHVNGFDDELPASYRQFFQSKGVPQFSPTNRYTMPRTDSYASRPVDTAPKLFPDPPFVERPMLFESDASDLPEQPVAIFCGDPNGPIYVYADGRHEQLKGRPSGGFWGTDPNASKIGESMREGGPGSGDPGHAGIPGHVGGSLPGKGGAGGSGGVERTIGKLLTATDGIIHRVMSAKFDKNPYEAGFTAFDDAVKFHLAHAPEDSTIYANALQRNMAIPQQVKRIDHLIFAHALTQYDGEPFNQFAGLTMDYAYDDSGLVAVAFNPHTYDPMNNGSSHSLPRKYATDKESYTRLVVAHEMGHVFYNAMPMKDKSRWHALYYGVQMKDAKKLFDWSNYGSSTPKEAFAEAYLAYTHKVHLPLPFNNFFAGKLGGNRLVEVPSSVVPESTSKPPFILESASSVTSDQAQRDKDVMFTTDGFDSFPSYDWLRDGSKVMIFDPANPDASKPTAKLKLTESKNKLKLVESNPDQARDDDGRWTSSGGTDAEKTVSVPDSLRKIGQLHADATHSPNAPATKAAYDALKTQTWKQYQDLLARGYKFDFGPNDSYRSSADMRNDVATRKTLAVYNEVNDLPPDHPLSAIAPNGQTYNTIFRAVHDMNGHYFTKHQFGPIGELNAYRAHAKMYDDKALPALASETLAQNAWVNYGPHEPEKLRIQERPFAEQKAYAFPLDEAKRMLPGEQMPLGEL